LAKGSRLGLIELNITGDGVKFDLGTGGIDVGGGIYDFAANVTKDDWQAAWNLTKDLTRQLLKSVGIENGKATRKLQETATNVVLSTNPNEKVREQMNPFTPYPDADPFAGVSSPPEAEDIKPWQMSFAGGTYLPGFGVQAFVDQSLLTASLNLTGMGFKIFYYRNGNQQK
jgi:hypothetical protein